MFNIFCYLFAVVRKDSLMEQIVHGVPDHEIRIVCAVRQTAGLATDGLRLIQVVIVTVAGELVCGVKCGRFGLWSLGGGG